MQKQRLFNERLYISLGYKNVSSGEKPARKDIDS